MFSFRSLRLRLALWYVLVLAIVLAAFSAGIYLTLRQSLSSNLNTQLRDRTEILLGVVRTDGAAPSLEGVVSETGADIDEQLVRLYDSDGRLTFDSSRGLASRANEAQLTNVLAGRTETGTVSIEDDDLRIRLVPVSSEGDIIGLLEVGLPEDDITDTLRTLLVILAVAYPSTLLLASAGGFFLAGRALSPIDGITRLARKISGEDLAQRLNMDLPDDEVGRLAATFDEMIERLDAAFQRQRQFTADASHELRTPLTAMRGQIEVALGHERDQASYRAVLRSVNEEIDRLISLVGSLLTLARADAGEIPIEAESVVLRDIVTAATEQVRSFAEAKDLELAIESGPAITANLDEDLTLQLMLNLLDNAIKYTDAGGSVTTGWDGTEHGARVWVSDTGIGIASEHVARVFDRFYRVDKARSRSEGGAGLGLSISRWIAEAHDAELTIESEPGRGTTVELAIPSSRISS